MKRTLSLVMIALMLLPVLLVSVSCGGTAEENKTDTSATSAYETAAQSTAAEAEALTLVENGTTSYIIVRAENSGEETVNACSYIRKAFRETLGVEIHITTDLTAETLKTDISKAIIVGTTSDEKTAELAKGLRYRDYKSVIDGDRIYISGGSDAALYTACEQFCSKNIVSGNTSVVLSADDMISYTQPVKFDSLTVNGHDLLDGCIVYDGSETAKDAADKLVTWFTDYYGVVMELSTTVAKNADCAVYLGYFKDKETCQKTVAGFSGHNLCWAAAAADNGFYLIGEGAASSEAAVDAFIAALDASDEKKLELSELKLSGDVTSVLKTEKDASADVRVMTSNILWVDNESISTAKRCEYLTDMYLSFGVDVICFNEFYGNPKTLLTDSLSSYYDIYYPEFEDVFNGDWTGYTNDLQKLKNHIQATPIAVSRSSGLTYVDGGFRYTSEKWWIHSITWVVLKTASGDMFAVINNHYGSQDVGNFALDTLKCTEDIRAEYKDIPVVIAGDLYSRKGELAYHTLTVAGYTDSCFNTKTRGSALGWGSSHTVGTLATGSSVPIDHLLFSAGDFECLKYHIVANKYTKWASDHYSVYADLKITK